MTLTHSGTSDAALGVMWKVLSAFVFTIMLTLVKVVGERVPVGEVLFARNFFGLLPVLVIVLWTHHLHDALRTEYFWGHMRRAVIGMVAMGMWFAALQRLSLPEATSIVYVAPLMMVVFAFFLLGERVRVYRWTAVAVGFLGVIVILLPQIRTGFDVANDAAALGALFALCAAVFMALASVFVRQLATREPTITVVLYFLIAGSALSLATLPTWTVPSATDAVLLVLIGVIGGVGQLLLTKAYQHAEASFIAPFEYTSMIWVVAFGYAVFGELPTINVIIGAAIVIMAGIFVIFRERQLGLARAERKVGAPLRP
ncbi:DMT family transporter [Acuticoccus sp.]|uniref:DMT family transporter n=1 Tax=Acuticoccus sp. TaxID=1904378 RepID=UPI003B51C1F9